MLEQGLAAVEDAWSITSDFYAVRFDEKFIGLRIGLRVIYKFHNFSPAFAEFKLIAHTRKAFLQKLSFGQQLRIGYDSAEAVKTYGASLELDAVRLRYDTGSLRNFRCLRSAAYEEPGNKGYQ